MEINKAINEIHQNAVKKGFWDKPTEFGTLLMLVVSELAEALEADRRKDEQKKAQKIQEICDAINEDSDKFTTMFDVYIKGSIDEEIADAVIRLFDICGGYGIDLENVMKTKMAYNKTRPYLHGKKY